MYRDSGIQSPGQSNSSPLWRVMILAALAGGLGWGIRGQYGHETGAMIAGVLVGFVLVLSSCSGSSKLSAIRAVGLCTVAIGFGGSMTYGQTIGLTQDAPLIGNWSALLWGMLGLAIKGGIWIGFAGAFLGMGLGGIRYGQREMFSGADGQAARVSVTPLPAVSNIELESVNMWREEVGLKPLTSEQLKEQAQEVQVGDTKGILVDLAPESTEGNPNAARTVGALANRVVNDWRLVILLRNAIGFNLRIPTANGKDRRPQRNGAQRQVMRQFAKLIVSHVVFSVSK